MAPRRQVGRLAEQDDADLVGIEVERHAVHAAREGHELFGRHAGQPLDARHSLAHRDHGAHLPRLDPRGVAIERVRERLIRLAEDVFQHPSAPQRATGRTAGAGAAASASRFATDSSTSARYWSTLQANLRPLM